MKPEFDVLTSLRRPTALEREAAERRRAVRLIRLGSSLAGLAWLIWLVKTWLLTGS